MAKNQAWLNKKNKRKHKKEVFESNRRKTEAQRIKKDKEKGSSSNWLSRSTVDHALYGRSMLHSYTNGNAYSVSSNLAYFYRAHQQTYQPTPWLPNLEGISYYQTKPKKLNVCWQKDGF